jgi:hypothetical protein
MYFFSKSSKDNAWNIERSKNLLSLYAIIFSSVLFLGIFELLNITRILREYSMLHNESSKLLKLLLAVLSYFIFSSYFSKKVKKYDTLKEKFITIPYKKIFDIIVFMTIPFLLVILGILIKVSF